MRTKKESVVQGSIKHGAKGSPAESDPYCARDEMRMARFESRATKGNDSHRAAALCQGNNLFTGARAGTQTRHVTGGNKPDLPWE
ncbi:hypothetical protein M514_01600, partial [Trichuris suis]